MVEQHTGQRDAAPLAAGEPAHGGLEPALEASHRDAAEQALEHAAELAVAGPLVLGRSPTSTSRIVTPAGRRSLWSSTPIRSPPRRVSWPLSGVSDPAISSSSVDFPWPLPPTTPMRSRSAIPSVRSSRIVRAA